MKNNTVGTKTNFAKLPEVPIANKLTGPEFNQVADFQKSPVQQETIFVDTSIVIDGTKEYSTTKVIAGATHTITAATSGHIQGNELRVRYQFDVDCTITLTDFESTGNNTGNITPIPAGTYDFKFRSNARGVNLLIPQNAAEATLADGNATTANGNAVDLGGTGNKTTIIDGTNSIDLIIGGDYELAKAWRTILMFAKNYWYSAVNDEGAYFELSDDQGGASSIANIFSEGKVFLHASTQHENSSPLNIYTGLIGIGVAPINELDVAGGMVVGTGVAGISTPTIDGLLVERGIRLGVGEEGVLADGLSFGVGITGFFGTNAERIKVRINNNNEFQFVSNAFVSETGFGAFFNKATSDIIPVFVPIFGASTTGVGSAGAGILSLIADAIEGIRVEAANATFSGAITNKQMAEPPNPADGDSVEWTHDGSGGTYGQGDRVIKSNVGGTTKAQILLDWSVL